MASCPDKLVQVDEKDVQVDVAAGAEKGKSRSCSRCCKCCCCTCCSCLLLLIIAGIVVFNTVLKIDAQNPPRPALPIADVMLGVAYSGSSDPNSDVAFKRDLVSAILGALPGSLNDTDGSIANSLQFNASRRLDSSRELASDEWTVVLPLVGEAAVGAADVFTSDAFSPASIANVKSLSVASDMSVLAMGHLLKDMNFVCRSAIAKALDSYHAEITSSLEKEDATGVALGINEDGWVWASFRKSGWKYSATALGCEATHAWEKAIESALELDLGPCTLSTEGIQALVGSGRAGDECYIDNIRNLVAEIFLVQCPAAGDSMCSSSNTVCEDFEYPGCSLCPNPSTVRYLPSAPFN